MKKYFYIILGLAVLILIFTSVIGKMNDRSWLFGTPSENKTFVDVVNQNSIQYSLINPNGWLRFDKSESAEGTPLIYIYGGDGLETAKAIIYSQTSPYQNMNDNLEKFIKLDESRLKEDNIIVKDLGSIQTKNRLSDRTSTAYLKSFTYQNQKGIWIYSTIAYIDAEKAAVIISMQTQDENLSRDLFPVFEKTVESYVRYVTETRN